MDAVAVDPVVEMRSECADRAQADAVLARMLEGVRAPRRASDAHWRVTAVVTTAGAGTRAVSAEIRDGRGELVAERTLGDRAAVGCSALVRAVGAWAQVVVDDALAREVEDASREERAAAKAADEAWAPRAAAQAPVDADEGASPLGGARAPSADRGLDLGSTIFLRNGAAANGGMFGVAPFAALVFASRWVVRGAGMYGTSTSRVPPDQSGSENVSSVGGRLDLCRRMPGNYIDQRGIEVDLCMGADTTRVWSSREYVWRGTVGPSAVLRGQMGHDVALELRSLLGMNVNRASFMGGDELPPVALGAELGASVRFQ